MPNDIAADFLTSLNAAPSGFHVCPTLQEKLLAACFTHLDERLPWTLQPGQAGFISRNGSALAAFRLAEQGAPQAAPFRIVAAHSDSPALKLKLPAAKMQAGSLRVPVEPYGSLIHSSWLDRPLALAGRIITEDGQASLVDSRRALAVIPNIAPHMQRSLNDGFVYNPQQHLAALFGETSISELLTLLLDGQKPACPEAPLAELFLYEPEAACLAGLKEDLLLASRLDNLASSYAAIEALCQSKASGVHQVVFLADHEEVGSRSAQGADSAFLKDFLTRMLGQNCNDELLLRSLAASFLLSADAAHAWHPNFMDAHDPDYAPLLNGGIVIKENISQRYAGSLPAQAWLRALCKKAGIPWQYFQVRADRPCGSTIGPACSALLGVQALDIGIAMWAMHSNRETAGRKDLQSMKNLLQAFFG